MYSNRKIYVLTLNVERHLIKLDGAGGKAGRPSIRETTKLTFTHFFRKYLLRIYYMPDTGAGYKAMN